MEAVKDKTNVISLHQPTGLFSPSLKRKLEEGVKPLTDKPTEVVEKVEMVICALLVSSILALAKTVGTRIGMKISGGR